MSRLRWEYRPDIDGLRALAVAIVILFHFNIHQIPGGFVGVDVFFVISGFLITSLIEREIPQKCFSFIDFYERRLRRIYPNLLIVLVVTAVLGFVAMVPFTYRPFGRSLVWAALSSSNFAFIGGNGYFDPGNLTKPLLHTWSLGVEEQFYLIFPWLLVLAAKRGFDAGWLIGSFVALSLVLSISAAMLSWSPSYFLLPTRFWELGIGALIAILPASDGLSSTQRSALGIAGLAAIAWAALHLSESDPFPGYLALVPTLGAAAVIWVNGGLAGQLLSFRPFVWIGRLSFALYLWHWPLITIAASIGLPPTDTTTRIVITTVMLVMSVAGYFIWEQPIRQRRLLRGRKVFSATLAAIMLAIVGTGIAIYQTKGVPQRLPADLVAMDEAVKQDSFLISQQCPTSAMGEGIECPLGDETVKEVSFAVIGDSHAQAVAAEIGALAKLHHRRGIYLGKVGCPPIEDIAWGQPSTCQLQYQFAMEEIQKRDPELVILLMQWSSLVGNPVNDKNGRIFKGGKAIYGPDRFQTAEDSLGKTLIRLGKRHIVTSITIPEYQYKSTFTWKIWMERSGFSSTSTDLTMEEYRNGQEYVRRLLYNEQGKHQNLSIIDPAVTFCSTGVCMREANNALLYRDSTHLSHAGAQIYVPLFESYLASLGGSGPQQFEMARRFSN